jgi:uncharacterized protein YutE (UPF0331/DUF86 family)
MVSFRNIAVHEYQNLDVEILKRIYTEHLKDFEELIEERVKYVRLQR